MEIISELVSTLIATQFPHYQHLPISPVKHSGHDNRTFHLGDELLVRLPSGKDYAPQIEKEACWLPFLSQQLTLPISTPAALGKPNVIFPYPWSINQYLKGETVTLDNLTSLDDFACDLAHFLKELQQIDTKNAPKAGTHNFYRGGDLTIYHKETLTALQELKDELPVDKLAQFWQEGLKEKWTKPTVWLHGDIASGNLLVEDGKLSGVIDFGMMAVGDPSCDYAMAWTFFDDSSRQVFLKDLDKDLILRARNWALWKALITYHDENAAVAKNAHNTITEILKEN